jgi:hypothetical protein
LLANHGDQGCCGSGSDGQDMRRCPCAGHMGDPGAGCTCSHLLVRGSSTPVLSLCVCQCSGCSCNGKEAIEQVGVAVPNS